MTNLFFKKWLELRSAAFFVVRNPEKIKEIPTSRRDSNPHINMIKEGRDIIAQYRGAALPGKNRMLREMGRYSVALYGYQVKLLDKEHALTTLEDGVIALDENHYNSNIGVDIQGEYNIW